MLEWLLLAMLAAAAFVVGRHLGLHSESGAPQYLGALALVAVAVYVVAAPVVSADGRWVSVMVGAYVGLFVGTSLRVWWSEESKLGEEKSR
jgi:hypothetical protein